MGEKEGYLPFPRSFETICVQHAEKIETKNPHKQIPTPLFLSNFYDSKECCPKVTGYVSGRIGNPTRCVLENVLAALNKAKYGLCFASGMGAITAVMALLKTGDHVIASDDLVGSTTELLMDMGSKFCIETTFVDFCHMENVEKAVRASSKLIWAENPSNPKLKVIDVCCTAQIASRYNILTAIDNTFLSPYLQRPLEMGIDIVMHSLSKYINGHSDVIMGCVCTDRKDLYERLKCIQTSWLKTNADVVKFYAWNLTSDHAVTDVSVLTICGIEIELFGLKHTKEFYFKHANFGQIPSPFDCYQVLRGLKTLPQRLKRHQQSSLMVAKYLINHPKIDQVIHPGLCTHPQHEIFKKQTSGHSGVISMYMKGGYEETKTFIDNLNIFTHAISLGGYESLVEIPVLATHRGLPQYMKDNLGLTENFVRLSIGLEDPCDLINDIEQSLEKVCTC